MLRNAVRMLVPGEREAIEAAYFLGMTHVEVAARLKQPLGTVKTRIRTALMSVRKAVKA